MTKTITFSIAAYNAENTLEKCLSSFLSLKNKAAVEVLIIDDGSTDSTAAIAERYERENPELYKLIRKENGGHGSTINTGVQKASGKYFRPIDSDDWVSPSTDEIIEKIEDKDFDAIACDFLVKHLNDGKEETRTYSFLKENSEDFISRRKDWPATFPYHSIFYKTEILRQNKIHFEEKCFYEDSEYTLYPLPFCESFFYTNEPLYVYTLGSSEQSVSFANVMKHIDNQEKILEKLFDFYTRNEKTDKSAYYRKRIFEVLNFYYKATMRREWYEDSSLQERKRAFFKRLEKSNPGLFLSYVGETNLRKVQHLTKYRIDGLIAKTYNFLKKRQG